MEKHDYNIANAAQGLLNLNGLTPLSPTLWSSQINEIIESDKPSEGRIIFKAENLVPDVGTFKLRGAFNAIRNLEGNPGALVTHSSGNHGRAVAYMAKQLGLDAHIVMPRNAPLQKELEIEDYATEIIHCDPTQEARMNTCKEICEALGDATFIHPYENPHVIEGQGTAAYEFLSQVPDLDYLLAPVSGGGLLAGTCLARNEIGSDAKVIGCEPARAADAYRSFYGDEGRVGHSKPVSTIADALKMPLGVRPYEIIKASADGMMVASESRIIQSRKIIEAHLGILIEPSSAVPLACILENPEFFMDKRIGIILSGRGFEACKDE